MTKTNTRVRKDSRKSAGTPQAPAIPETASVPNGIPPTKPHALTLDLQPGELEKWKHLAKARSLSTSELVLKLARQTFQDEIAARDQEEWRFNAARRESEMRRGIELELPRVNGGSLSDAELVDYMSAVMVDHQAALERLARRGMERAEDDWDTMCAQSLHEAIVAARAAHARAQWEGLKGTPLVTRDRPRGAARVPLLLPLPGIAGRKAYSDVALVEWFNVVLHHYRNEIRAEIIGQITEPTKAVEWNEVLMLAEQAYARDGSQTELEDGRSPSQSLAGKAAWISHAGLILSKHLS